MVNILKVEVTGIQVKGSKLVGDLWYDPLNVYVDEYVFRKDDILEVNNDGTAFILMDQEYLLDLAYGDNI